jgi:hypothetical protein
MNYRPRRHRGYCEGSAPYCDSDRPIDRCEPPISWPQRPSPSLSNFPGISIFWPMPMVIPITPSLGGWGTMRSSAEEPYYADRRPYMNRYRCYEPANRHSERCCERCGCYECRCDRCERCGCYECRCDRCDRCGCHECRCARCAKCGQRECRCGEYSDSRPVEVVVLPEDGFKHNSELVDREKQYIYEDAHPIVRDFLGQKMTKNVQNRIPAPTVSANSNKVTITIKIPAATDTDMYTAVICDAGQNSAIPKVLGYLTLVVY